MSDIDLSGLDWIIWTFVAACFVAPPLILGVIILAIGIFVRQKRALLAIYLGVSTIISSFILWRLGDWQNWPLLGYLALPIGAGLALVCWALYCLLRWTWRKALSKKLASDRSV
jgi:hypothetical protein